MKTPSFLSEPLAIYPPVMANWLLNRRELASVDALSIADFVIQRKPYSVDEQGIATIHVNDVLSRGLTNIEKMLGETDYDDLAAEIDQAASDPAVKGILLDVNSPGGSVVGMLETAQSVDNATQSKPVVANIGSIGASAAYGIACAASGIVASRSARVGSIGTILTHHEMSAMLEAMGINVTIITPKGADLKAAGNSVRTMTDEEKDYLQAHVEQVNSEFKSWVTSHRASVGDESMRGQCLSGSAALQAGLIDQIGNRADAYAALHALISLSK